MWNKKKGIICQFSTTILMRKQGIIFCQVWLSNFTITGMEKNGNQFYCFYLTRCIVLWYILAVVMVLLHKIKQIE